MTDKTMSRRTALKTAVLVAAAAGASAASCAQPTEPQGEAASSGKTATATGHMPTPGIVLYCDLKVDAAKEKAMLDHFHNVFAPAGAKFEGFIDVKMLKLRTIIQGDPLPTGINYRFQLTYVNEELRQIWVNSQVHTEVWKGIDDALLEKNFQVALFDVR